MQPLGSVVLCTALALGGCAAGSSSPGQAANTAPAGASSLSPVAPATISAAIEATLGVWYAGTTRGFPHPVTARIVYKIEQLPSGKLQVRDCSAVSADLDATAPTPDMKCVIARNVTTAGDSMHFLGSDGDHVTLTFGNDTSEYQYKTVYPRNVLTATMHREQS